jgi:RNA polymerase primary sigma factor
VARARDAEQRAKSRFVGANLRLVISMTRRYHRSLLPLEDLVQEGNLGLMRAVERFDYRRGYRFSTYATWWIRHGLNRAVSDKARLVRIPVHALDELSRVARATEHVRARTGTTPNARELATETGIHESKLTRLKMENPLQPPISLDQDISAEREQTLHEILPAREQPDLVQSLDLSSWRQQLERLLCQLRPMEAEVLRFRFGLDGGEELTLREIGQKYSLSRERIRQVQAEALAKLRKAVGPGFDDFENARAA